MLLKRPLAQEIRLGSPDISPRERVGSGDETRYFSSDGLDCTRHCFDKAANFLFQDSWVFSLGTWLFYPVILSCGVFTLQLRSP